MHSRDGHLLGTTHGHPKIARRPKRHISVAASRRVSQSLRVLRRQRPRGLPVGNSSTSTSFYADRNHRSLPDNTISYCLVLSLVSSRLPLKLLRAQSVKMETTVVHQKQTINPTWHRIVRFETTPPPPPSKPNE